MVPRVGAAGRTSLGGGRGAGEPLEREPPSLELLVIQVGDRGATHLLLLALLRALLLLSVILALTAGQLLGVRCHDSRAGRSCAQLTSVMMGSQGWSHME